MKKLLMGMVAVLGMSAAAMAGPADPGTYYDEVVNSNSSNVYYEYLYADGEETWITLNGFCSGGQDIDLWVYDVSSGQLIDKSTGYGCNEHVSIWTRFDSSIKIVVENQNKPYATGYNLTVE